MGWIILFSILIGVQLVLFAVNITHKNWSAILINVIGLTICIFELAHK